MAVLTAKFLAETFAQGTPSGTVNGSNTAFALPSAPESSAAVVLMQDGIPQVQVTDYTISGSSITMTIAPAFGQSLYFYYIKKS